MPKAMLRANSPNPLYNKSRARHKYADSIVITGPNWKVVRQTNILIIVVV